MQNGSSWESVLSKYADHLGASVSPGTRRIRHHHAQRFSYLADSPQQITTADLEKFMAAYTSAEYRKSVRASARRFFSWATEAEIIARDPSIALRAVRAPKGSPRPCPDDILIPALSAADADTRLMMMLARFAGLRDCEIARVHTDDVGAELRVEGKGGTVRHVPLVPELLELLHARRGWVFPGQIDGHIAAGTICKRVSRALPGKWTSHTLRHRFATECYAGERDILAVQELLGHASVATTQIYTLMPREALNRAVIAAGSAIVRAAA